MAALIAFYSRAGENYFGGAYRRISVGNTEKVAEMLADLTGGELYKIEQAEPYSDDYKTCVAQAREDWQKNARPAVLDRPMTSTPMMKFTSATPTIAVRCRWRSTPSSSTMTGRARPSIRSARMRAAACRTRSRTSGGLRRARGSRTACRCAAARSRVQNRSWSSGCADNTRVLTDREEGGCA